MNETIVSALQEMIDRRAMRSVQEQGAVGHAAIESARWHQTQKAVEAIERLLDSTDGAQVSK